MHLRFGTLLLDPITHTHTRHTTPPSRVYIWQSSNLCRRSWYPLHPLVVLAFRCCRDISACLPACLPACLLACVTKDNQQGTPSFLKDVKKRKKNGYSNLFLFILVNVCPLNRHQPCAIDQTLTKLTVCHRPRTWWGTTSPRSYAATTLLEARHSQLVIKMAQHGLEMCFC